MFAAQLILIQTISKMANQIRKNLVTTTALNVFTYLIPLFVTPYFVRIAGAENFGLLNIAQSIIQYLFLFVGFNLDVFGAGEAAVSKNNPTRIQELFWAIFTARLVLLGIATLIFLVIIVIRLLNHQDIFLLAVTFIGLIGYAITPLWLYQGLEKFRQLFLMIVIGKLCFAGIVFFAIKEPSDYWFYNLGVSLSNILTGALLLGYAIKKLQFFSPVLDWKASIDFLKAKFPLFKGGTIVNFGANISVTILGILLPIKDFGLYMAANKLILIFFSVVTLPLNQSLYPSIARSIAEDFTKALVMLRAAVIPLLSYFTVIVSVVGILFSRVAIDIMLGPAFSSADLLLKIMIFSLVANVLSNVVTLQLFIRRNLMGQYSFTTQASVVSGIIATITGAYYGGVIGASWAWLVSEFLLFIYSVIVLKKLGISLFSFSAFHPGRLYAQISHKGLSSFG